MKADISIDNFIITDIKSSGGRRAMLAAEIVISSAVAVNNADPAALKTNLNTAITDGAFTQALVADGFTTAAASSVASLVDTTSTSPTAAPTSGPKEEEKPFPPGSAAGIAIGLIAFIGIVCGLVYYFVLRKRDSGKPWGGAKESAKGEDFGRGPYNDDGHSQNILHQAKETEEVK